MSVNRGYVGDHASRKGRRLPKRVKCPECGKRGVFGPFPAITVPLMMRECQYCRTTWLPDSWATATTTGNANV